MSTFLARARTAANYFGALLVVAMGAAYFAIGFRWLLGVAYRTLSHATGVVSMFESLTPWERVLLPTIGGLFAGGAAYAISRFRSAQGVGDVDGRTYGARAHDGSRARIRTF